MKVIIRQTNNNNFKHGYEPLNDKLDVLDDRGNIVGHVLSIRNVMLSKGDVEVIVEIIDPVIVQKIKDK